MMHSGSPDHLVTMLRSPGIGSRLPSASKDQTDPAVARLMPRSTSSASSFASCSLSPRRRPRRTRCVHAIDGLAEGVPEVAQVRGYRHALVAAERSGSAAPAGAPTSAASATPDNAIVIPLPRSRLTFPSSRLRQRRSKPERPCEPFQSCRCILIVLPIIAVDRKTMKTMMNALDNPSGDRCLLAWNVRSLAHSRPGHASR